MADPRFVDPNADAALLDSISSEQLGVPPQAAPAAPPAKPEAPKGDTAMDKVQTSAAPETEGKAADDAPVMYKVDIDGQTREFTPKQIADTHKRYADLNYKHQTQYAPIAPAVDLLNKIMSQAKAEGLTISGDELASFLQEALLAQANTKDAEFGAQSANNTPPPKDTARTNIPMSHQSMPGTPEDFEAQLAQWEADNAVNLPPMYKDMARQLQQANAQIQNMGQYMQSLVGQMQGVTQTAQGMQKEGATAQNKAYLQTIANNLQASQLKYQLPDDKEKDFMLFAGERGYSIEDFIDPNLTEKVVADFKANMDGPEMQRLRDINARRQAFTGTLNPGGAAGGPGQPTTPPAEGADDPMLNAIAQQAMQAKNMV